MNSDTPRTDVFAQQIHEGHCFPTCNSFAHDDNCPVCNGEYLLADFARTLEHENQQLRDELKQCAEALNTAIGTVECASVDLNTQEEIPWYKQAKKALSLQSVQDALKEPKQ